MIEVEYTQYVVNLLPVSTNPPGKQRLILNLRYVNNCLYKERIVVKDCLRNYVSGNSFPHKFVLKNAYYHVDIDPKY